MNNLDRFLKGLEESYEYAKYGERDYGVAKVVVRNRFVLIYETDIANVLARYREAEFKGIFDKEKEIIYVESEYYNLLYDESEFSKTKIDTIQKEMDRYVNEKYTKYIMNNKQDLKAMAYPKYKEFYDIKENQISLREELETAYKDNVPTDFIPKFGLEAPVRLNDVLDYIEDKDKYADRVIEDKLNKTDIRISSHYSGIPDLFVTQKEYIGFKLVKQEKLNEMAKLIDEGKDERSPILRKLRAITQFVNANSDIKNIVVGLTYNNNSIEVTYPMQHLGRLDLESWYMPVKDREIFGNMFTGYGWQEREKIMNSIQYFKYRGKIIWEDKG